MKQSDPARRPARRLLWALACLCLLALSAQSSAMEDEWVPDGPPTVTHPTADPAADLAMKRDKIRAELDALSKSISISEERAAALEADIADLEKSSASLRAAIVTSATTRQELERKVLDGERRLQEMRDKEADVHMSLQARRGVLAEVLAALQRMGRNPPPALLVTPEDALASVRSAILLGAVVPGIRHETEKLTVDLQALADVRRDITDERETLTANLRAALEEEKRISLLATEKDKLRTRSAGDLVAERQKAEALAGQATSLAGLIGSLERDISSVREAATAALAEEAERRRMSDEQREKARELARTTVPDKNRIAPAYVFSDLKKKLPLPVAGTPVRNFGDEDGTGHTSQGMMLETGADGLVTAPADGWVVYAGSFRSYGQMVILNAGDGYHLVLSGMERVSVSQGQFVVAGEPIAVMGAKRVASATALPLETDRPTLYIEFRKDGKPVDSRPWWTASATGKARNDT